MSFPPHPRRVFDFLFVLPPGAEDWRMVSGEWDFPVGRFSLGVAPGETWVGLQPRYNTADLAGFIDGLRKRGRPDVAIRSAGKSREGREVPVVVVSEGAGAKQPVLITARMHPYESAGSFAVEGMIKWLLGDDACEFRRGHEFHIAAMVNVDGVHNGLSRLTDLRGANVNRVHAVSDRTHDAIRALVEEVRPRLVIDLHNFLEKARDDARSTDGEFLRRLARRLPDQSRFGKRWRQITWDVAKISDEDINWCHFVAREYGGVGVMFELPWFRRSGGDMRGLGAGILQAVLRTHAE